MRYRSFMGLVAAVSLAFAGGCGDDDVETVATDEAFVAPLGDYDVTTNTAFWYDGVYDPYVVAYQITPPDDGGTDGGVGSGRTIPRPLAGLLAAWHVSLRSDCVTASTVVDADQDRVPASYTAAFNCPTLTVGDRTSSATGTVAIADTDDTVRLSGATVSFTNFQVVTANNGRTRSRTLNGTVTLAPNGSGALQSTSSLTVAFDFTDSNGKHAEGTYTSMGLATYTPDTSAGADVFASGTVTLSGQGTLQRTDRNGSRTVTRTTDPQLHWNRSCRTQNGDSLGYDSGTLVYRDDQSSKLQLEFKGCGDPKITTND